MLEKSSIMLKFMGSFETLILKSVVLIYGSKIGKCLVISLRVNLESVKVK